MADAERWGVDIGYHDAAGAWRQPPAATIDAVLGVMGARRVPGPPAVQPAARLAAAGRIDLEDGGTVDMSGTLPPDLLPPDLPFGYHRFTPAGGGDARLLIVSPRRCRLPPPQKVWGWSAQLYGVRSATSWGIGDLADLHRLGEWGVSRGAGLTMINPLHASLPGQPESPYFASSRCFRSPLYLHVEDVPGAADLPEMDALVTAGRALNAARRIDRAAIWRLKTAALEVLYARFSGHPAFTGYCREQGAALDGYASFCALSEVHGLEWEKWPAAVRRPDAAGVASFAASRAGGRRIRYHAWLQWLLDAQLAAAARPLGIVNDLAVGANPLGADAWRWQDSLAMGMTVGAPPDEFNAAGQDWGFPPFDPWRLRSAGYQPFIDAVRAGLRHAAGIRIDHVMGLFRQFWIPAGAGPEDGTYVRYPSSDLLDILALESHRSGAYVVGEDLGTVEESTRRDLAGRGVLSYRLLWFEPELPGSGQWPVQALAAVTTHDLPTVAGLWSGADLEAQHALGLHPNAAAIQATRARLARWLGVDDGAAVEEVIERAYQLVGQSPCLIATATLEDALAVRERPNVPGTVDQWPNWSLALPRPLEELQRAPLAARVAAALNQRRGAVEGNPLARP
jgi:4-alpha-glucanotransferase